MKSKIIILITLVVLVLTVTGVVITNVKNKPVSGQLIVAAKTTDAFSYKGENGKNALIILKKMAKVEQGSSGLVTSINGRLALSLKREFWAFYVNGKMANVGPAEYNTKDQDLIKWQIEKY